MISVIIPSYNEADAIGPVIDRVNEVLAGMDCLSEIIVVDDGSDDGTVAALVGKKVQLYTHHENKGYGAALKTGIRNAKGDIIVITDADGTYPVENIPEIVKGVRDGGYDMVVGARTGEDVNIPLIRRPAKYAIKKLADFLSETKIPDINSGLRAFRKDLALKYFHLFPNGFSFTTTITLALLCDAYNVKYLPIDYHTRAGGKSKIKPLRDFTNFLLLIVRSICYFNPLKIFLPMSALLTLVGGCYTVYTVAMFRNITDAGVFTVLLGFQIGFIGLMADVMVRRDRWSK